MEAKTAACLPNIHSALFTQIVFLNHCIQLKRSPSQIPLHVEMCIFTTAVTTTHQSRTFPGAGSTPYRGNTPSCSPFLRGEAVILKPDVGGPSKESLPSVEHSLFCFCLVTLIRGLCFVFSKDLFLVVVILFFFVSFSPLPLCVIYFLFL